MNENSTANTVNVQKKIMSNRELFLKYLQNIGVLETMEELNRRMLIIPKNSRTILEISWGLDEKNCYSNYNVLDKALGKRNSNTIQQKLIKELEDAKYVELLRDYKNFSWKIATNLGHLASIVIDNPEPNSVIGKKFLEVISQKLTKREATVLQLHNGIINKGDKATLKELSSKFNVSKEWIRQIEKKSIIKLRYPLNLRIFYDPELNIYEKNKKIHIEDCDFSTRAYKCLKKAGYTYLQELEYAHESDLLSIQGLGYGTLKEIKNKVNLLL